MSTGSSSTGTSRSARPLPGPAWPPPPRSGAIGGSSMWPCTRCSGTCPATTALAARHPSMPRSERRFSTGLPESVSVTRAGTGCMSVPASSVQLTHLLADRIMNRTSAKATAGVLTIVPKLAPSVSPPAWRVLLRWLCTNPGGQ